MSTASKAATLEQAIRESGEGWILDLFEPRAEALGHIRSTLARVDEIARATLSENSPQLSEAALLHEFQRNPQRVRGFFQALGGTRTPQMLLMVWRIIQGMEVKSVNVDYE